MQTDNAKQGSGLKLVKWLVAVVLVPGLGVPATKLVESHYDVSYVSSATSALGTWLSQPIPVLLWMLIAGTVCVLLLMGVGLWAINDAKLSAANVEPNSVGAKLYAANKELGTANSKLLATRDKLDIANMELAAAYAMITDLQTPKVEPLTEGQDKVIAAIAAYDSEGEDCSTKDFPGRIGLTLLEADGAMDVLEARKWIDFQYYNGQRYVTLTAKGRAYVLRPDFVMPTLPSR